MPAWVWPLASAGASALQTYLQGRGQKRGYDMSPQEQRLMDVLMKQYKGAVPGEVTAPFVRREKRIRRKYAGMPGVSGIESALVKRHADVPRSQAVSRYKQSLVPQMAMLARGTGTQWQKGPLDIGPGLEDLGWALYMMTHGKKKGSAQGSFYPGGGAPPWLTDLNFGR